MNEQMAAVILAAGMGKRMGSAQPKAMCKVLGKPMLNWVIDSCIESNIQDICVVASHPDALPIPEGISVCYQQEKRGTGHAVQMAVDFLSSLQCKDVVVLYGDAPFVNGETLAAAKAQHDERNSHITVITAELEDPARYGRMLYDDKGLSGIIEYADATEEQRKIKEINSGIYLFDREMLLKLLPEIEPQNAQGEYYLTDMIAIALSHGYKADGYRAEDARVVQGANDRKGLAQLNVLAREMVLDRHYANGVDIPFGDTVLIGPDVLIGGDSEIGTGVTLLGKTVIGEGVKIGSGVEIVDSIVDNKTVLTSGTRIENSTIGADCCIQSSTLHDSTVGKGVRLGPYAQLRPNSHLGDYAKVGNFVEIKNSTIGVKTSVAHLTYIGDTDVGSGCNFGCGVVTVNYDGGKKYRSQIGDNVFIGCNTNLISPVEVGDNSYIAAATTVTDNVPAEAFAIGRCRQINKEGYQKMPNRKGK